MEPEIVWLPDFRIVGIKQAASSTDSDGKNPQSARFETKHSSQQGCGAVPTSFPNLGRRKADERIAEDRIGEELAPDATIWELYHDEANEFDSELAEGRGNNLDMMLLFAGLFSAVVTSFLIESKNMLQQDPADASLVLLLHIARSQQRLEEGTPRPVSPMIEIPSFETPKSARWINGLWFSSLALSLGAALIAMLAKEWIIAFATSRPRSPYDHALLHQKRLQGLRRWYALHMIDFLPTVIHFALLLFSIGLVLYLWTLDYAIAAAVVFIVGVSVFFYAATAVLASIYPFCPFVTQVSKYIQRAFIPDQISSPPTHANSNYRTPGTSLEVLQALKWLAENARDQTAADCSYQALAGIKITHDEAKDSGMFNDCYGVLGNSPSQTVEAHITTSNSQYNLLAEMFQTICSRIPQVLASETGQLSASQGISVSRYAIALPRLVQLLERRLIEPTLRELKKPHNWAQTTPSQAALAALDFAWNNNRPYYTADTYALLTAAELHLTTIAASYHCSEQPDLATAPLSPLHIDTSDSNASNQSWSLVDVIDVGAPAERTSLFDLRARFSRALFRATLELKYYADGSIHIRKDALVNLLGSIALGFLCPDLHPNAPLSTHQQQSTNNEALPVFRVGIIGTGIDRWLEPCEIDDEDGLLIGLMRIICTETTGELSEHILAAMRALCLAAPILLRQWLNMNLDLNPTSEERSLIYTALSDLQVLQPETPNSDGDPAYLLGVWTMKQLLVIALISGTFAGSTLVGIQHLSEHAMQTLCQLTKGSMCQNCASDAAAESSRSILKLIQMMLSVKDRPSSPELKYFVQWLLIKVEIDNITLIQRARKGDQLACRTNDVYLELLEIWAQVPGLDSELEDIIDKILMGPMGDALDPLWSSSGVLTLANIGRHVHYAPRLSKLIAHMITLFLGENNGAGHWGDPSHAHALPNFICAVGLVLNATPSPTPEHPILSEAFLCAISNLRSRLQANLVNEGFGSCESTFFEMIREVLLDRFAVSTRREELLSDYEELSGIASDPEAWMYGTLSRLFIEDSI